MPRVSTYFQFFCVLTLVWMIAVCGLTLMHGLVVCNGVHGNFGSSMSPWQTVICERKKRKKKFDLFVRCAPQSGAIMRSQVWSLTCGSLQIVRRSLQVADVCSLQEIDLFQDIIHHWAAWLFSWPWIQGLVHFHGAGRMWQIKMWCKILICTCHSNWYKNTNRSYWNHCSSSCSSLSPSSPPSK